MAEPPLPDHFRTFRVTKRDPHARALMHISGFGKNPSRAHAVELTHIELEGGVSMRSGTFEVTPQCIVLERLLATVRGDFFSDLRILTDVKTVVCPVLFDVDAPVQSSRFIQNGLQILTELYSLAAYQFLITMTPWWMCSLQRTPFSL